MSRHTAPQTCWVAFADAAGSNDFRHSLHRRPIAEACAAAEAASGGHVDQYPAAAEARSRGQVDLYPAAKWIRLRPPPKDQPARS